MCDYKVLTHAFSFYSAHGRGELDPSRQCARPLLWLISADCLRSVFHHTRTLESSGFGHRAQTDRIRSESVSDACRAVAEDPQDRLKVRSSWAGMWLALVKVTRVPGCAH